MFIAEMPHWTAQLSISVRLANGKEIPERVVSRDELYTQTKGFWLSLWRGLRREGTIPLTMGFTAFLTWVLQHQFGIHAPIMLSLVTTAGIAYETTAFAGGASVGNFLYHESGTSNTPATIAQTDLVAAVSQARTLGVNSNPIAGTLLSVATIAYSGTLSIQEWGLFSTLGTGTPPTGGTLWDRRVVSPVQGVNTGDSVTYNYAGVATAGGA